MINSTFNNMLSTAKAMPWMMKYYNGEMQPYELAKTYTVTPQVTMMLPITDKENKGYQYSWQETWRDRMGNELRTDKYQGTLTYELRDAKDDKTFRDNPTGTYVVWLDFTEIMPTTK
jgi:type IV secretory pathway TrbF-like protein